MTQEGAETNSGTANWLVKSGDRILGPFSREQITEMLREKELVVIDETSQPQGRWRYIRDEPVFAAIVEEVRKLHLSSREDTELGSADRTAITDANVTHTQPPPAATAGPRDAGARAPQSSQSASPDNTRSAAQTPRSYGSASKAQDSISTTARLIWIAAIVICAGAAFLFFRLQKAAVVAEAPASATHLAAKAALSRSLGDFPGAIIAYQQLEEAGKLTPEMQIDHAVLRSRLRDEANPPARILDGISVEKLNGTNAAQYETARGLIALNETRNAESLKAAEAHFSKAVTADRSFAPAAFNSTVAAFLLSSIEPFDAKKTARIANEFLRVSEMPSLDPSGRVAAKVMAALVRLKSNDSALVSEAVDDLARLQKNIVQYWQEASLLSAYGKLKQGQNAQASRDLRLTLGADPFVTDEHLTDPYLYTYPLSWQSLKPLCEEFHQVTTSTQASQGNRKPDATTDAMLQFCRFKAGDRVDEARTTMKELELKSVSDPLVRSISAYMVMKISPEEAKAKLADASDSVSWELGRILRGRLCALDDLGCLNRAFRATAVLRTAIYFKVGAARYLFSQAESLKQQGNVTEANAQVESAREILETVKGLSPNYIPLLMVEANQGK